MRGISTIKEMTTPVAIKLSLLRPDFRRKGARQGALMAGEAAEKAAEQASEGQVFLLH